MDYPDAVRRVFAHYASRSESRYGDKMPAAVQRIPALAAMFPEGRFVHIIRDGRDVALSAMAIAGQRRDPVALAIDWRRRRRPVARQARLGSRRYHEVRYERLVSDPASRSPTCAGSSTSTATRRLQFFERRDNVPARSAPTLGTRARRAAVVGFSFVADRHATDRPRPFRGCRRPTPHRARLRARCPASDDHGPGGLGLCACVGGCTAVASASRAWCGALGRGVGRSATVTAAATSLSASPFTALE